MEAAGAAVVAADAAAGDVRDAAAALAARWAAVGAAAAARTEALAAARIFQDWAHAAAEATAWATDRLPAASDEAHREPTNLDGKTKAHAAFAVRRGE